MVKNKALNIVVIDDNHHMRSSLEQLLSVLGHSVQAAETGERGIRLAVDTRPDLVICDISLGGAINGYGVARTLRLNQQLDHTFMVALSGNSQQEDRERSAHAGFDRHVAKPVALCNIEALLDDTHLHRLRRSRRMPG